MKETELRIGNYIDVNLQFLHQLQNLYFALSSKELEVFF